MAGKIIIISTREADVAFGQKIGLELKREVIALSDLRIAGELLMDDPQCVLLCEADEPDYFSKIAKAIYGRIPRHRVFVVTDRPLNQYPELFTHQVFGHHLVRRFIDPAAQVVAHIMRVSLTARASGVEGFFPDTSSPKIQRIEIVQSAHKGAAVKAVRNFLIKLGIIERMATKIAQASDELLLNAIYDAPILQDGTRYRRTGNRDTDFTIEGGVALTFAEGEDYAAISIADSFGSLDKEEIMFALKRDFQERDYIVRPGSGGGGLGLNSIIQSGLSVVLVTRPKLRTEAVLLFPKAKTYKEFRSSFSIFGVIGI